MRKGQNCTCRLLLQKELNVSVPIYSAMNLQRMAMKMEFIAGHMKSMENNEYFFGKNERDRMMEIWKYGTMEIWIIWDNLILIINYYGILKIEINRLKKIGKALQPND